MCNKLANLGFNFDRKSTWNNWNVKNFYHWLLSVTGRIIAIRLFLLKQLQIPFLGQGRYNQVIISYITVFYLPLVFVVGCCNYRNFQEEAINLFCSVKLHQGGLDSGYRTMATLSTISILVDSSIQLLV